MTTPHERVRHVQAVLSQPQYERFKRAAEEKRLSVQAAATAALLRWAAEEGSAPDPFDALVGRFHGPTDASVDVDAEYDEV